MDLDDVKAEGQRLSMWAHMATVGADGGPDVVPVHPAWENDTLWIMTGTRSVKVRNIEANPKVALHWQVGESGDGLELWGTATTHTDVETKKRLWNGVFDYDLSAFSPGGPEDSGGTAFVAVQPERAVAVKAFGAGGRETWRA
jgi:general stress protein 26